LGSYSVVEFPVPTPGSRPVGFAAQGDSMWFSEYEGNKVARIFAKGSFLELPLPTPNSKPEGIACCDRLERGGVTEVAGSQIGGVDSAIQAIEYTVPTSDSGPRGILLDPDDNLWFTEFKGNKIGVLSFQSEFKEYAIPTPLSAPWGIALGPGRDCCTLDFWFTE